MLLALLILAAIVTSAISAVTGMAGGGMLLGFMVAFGLTPTHAIPVHAAVQLVSNLSRVLMNLDDVRVRPFVVHAACALPGPVLGLWLLGRLNPRHVEVGIGVFMLWSVFGPRRRALELSDETALGIAGVLSGILGVVVGAVDPLLAPFFLRQGFSKEQLVATKAACQAFNHVIKLVAFAGFYPTLAETVAPVRFTDELGLIVPLSVAAIAGTYLGKRLLSRLPDGPFRLIYRVLLVGLALRLIVAAFI